MIDDILYYNVLSVIIIFYYYIYYNYYTITKNLAFKDIHILYKLEQ